MLKRRLIPVLYLKNGLVVRSEEFNDFREMGNPISQLQRLNAWCADELVYIDITRSGEHDLKRDDLKTKNYSNIIDILRTISQHCFMPLTFGGRISNFEQAAAIIANGADKIIINSSAYRSPELITKIANHFGSQCVVVGIDVRRQNGVHQAYIDQGKTRIDPLPEDWACQAAGLGAGEIFLNSIDRDGTAAGFDLEIIERVSSAVNIPVIACGGAGEMSHFVDVLQNTSASAVAAGNIFNYSENAYVLAKRTLVQNNCDVRPFVHRQ
jgi:cyclase